MTVEDDLLAANVEAMEMETEARARVGELQEECDTLKAEVERLEAELVEARTAMIVIAMRGYPGASHVAREALAKHPAQPEETK